MTRTLFAFVAALAALTLSAPAHASINACAAAKKLCVAKKTAALLKCHSKNEKPPTGLDPAKFALCVQKAKDKFDGGANPAKGCFAKIQTKFPGGCLSTNDTAALENKVDAFVDDVVCALDPAGGTCAATPTPTPTSTPGCNALGQGCASGSQCCSLACQANVCVASCSNGMQDGNETGVDCGGSCAPCGFGGGCSGNLDCVATTTCSGGQCVCAPGKSDCNNVAADGCEVSTGNDPANCGNCGHICNVQNAMPGCMAGQCGIASCAPGFSDCDGLVADGCEVDTTSSNGNCGGCNLTCPNPLTCVNSTCQ